MPGEPDIEIGYRLLIPVVHVGALIGRQGEAIAQLRQRTGARVKVHDAHDGQPLPAHVFSLTHRLLSICMSVFCVTVNPQHDIYNSNLCAINPCASKS